MFHFDHSSMLEQVDHQTPNNIMSYPLTGSSIDSTTQQKTLEEIHLKVMIVRKFIVQAPSLNDLQPAESPLYMEESRPVLMKLGEREIHHMPASRDPDLTSFYKYEMKVNSHLCEMIPVTESIGLRFCSTSSVSGSQQLGPDSITIVSELVSLLQNDLSKAAHIGKISTSCCENHEDKSEANPMFVSRSTQTTGEEFSDNSITLSVPDSNSITSVTPNNCGTSLESNGCICSPAQNCNSSLAPNNKCTSASSDYVSSLVQTYCTSLTSNNDGITSVNPNNCISSPAHDNNGITSMKSNNSGMASLAPNSDCITSLAPNKCLTSLVSNINCTTSLVPNDDEYFQPTYLPCVPSPPSNKILTSSSSLCNTNSSRWLSDNKNQVNGDYKVKTLPDGNGNDGVKWRKMNKKETISSEKSNEELNSAARSDAEHEKTELQVVKVVSNTDTFKKKDICTSLLSRQLQSGKCRHKATCRCKTCKQLVCYVSGQVKSCNHRCTTCDKVFISESLLHKHLSEHEVSSNHDNCNCVCGHVFSNYSGFMKHDKNCDILTKHGNNEVEQQTVLTGKKCTMKSSSLSLKNHADMHHSKSSKYTCCLCENVFRTRSGLARHRHKTCDPFLCNRCDFKCKDGELMKKHLTTHTEANTGQTFKCAKCSKTFFSSFQHQNHSCGNYTHSLYQVGESWKCPKCKKSYTSQSTIYRHKVKGCLGEKSYKCDTCNKGFHTPQAVEEHVKIHKSMNEQGRHYCSQCNKSYSRRSGYLKHKRKGLCDINSVFRCVYCPKVFMKESRRDWHQRMHPASENQQTHVCKSCHKEYFSAKSLQKHIQRDTCKKASSFTERHADRKFVCEECGKVYGSSSALFKHKQNHRGFRPYVCKFCGKSFCRSFILAQHTKIHTGDRQWLCSQCGKSFYTKSHLKRHQISHDKTQNNVCEVCNKRYAYKHDLNKHRKTVHVKESVNLLFPPSDMVDEVVASTLNIQNELTSSHFM